MIKYYAAAENILKPEKIKTEFSVSEVHYEAMGIILGVMPWNFSFLAGFEVCDSGNSCR
jgi:succinate-semialdehyde dehydrogenase/glutarate-semialdehyde dehydrogenase